jgi:putative ABC transport system permease protein
VYSGGKTIHQLMVSGGNLSLPEMRILEEKIKHSFAMRKLYDPADLRAVRTRNNAEDFAQFTSLFDTFSIISWIIGICSILAGIIGVSNIMLIVVKDRTKEIGIRKAIGATPASIVMMIIQEAILITSVAGYLGMLLGISKILLISGVESDFFRHPRVELKIVIAATVVLIISGALAGLLPAYKAAKINPVEAIKSQ